MSDSNKISNKLKLSQLMDGEWHQLNPSECVVSLCHDEALRGSWMRYHLIRDAIRNEPVRADEALVARICDAIKDEPDYSNIRPFNGSGIQQPAHSDADRPSADLSDTSPSSLPEAGESGGVKQSAYPAEKPAVLRVEGAADGSPTSVSDNSMHHNSLKHDEKKTSLFSTGLAGFGLAASVALATVIGLDLFQQQPLDQAPALASNDAAVPANVITTPVSAAGADGLVQRGTVDNALAQDDTVNLPVVEFVSNDGSYWESPSSSERVVDEERLNMMLSLHIENSPTTGREGLLPYSRLVGYDESNSGR